MSNPQKELAESLFGQRVAGLGLKDEDVVGEIVGYDTRPIAGGEDGDFLVVMCPDRNRHFINMNSTWEIVQPKS